MSDMCPRCGRVAADGLLCRRCLSDAHKALRLIAVHWADVYLHRPGQGASGHVSGPRYPLTDNQVKVSSYVRNQLSTWVRELDMGDTVGLADDPVMWALWLSTRTQRIRSHAAGDEAIDEFVYCADKVMRAIENPLRRIGCGKCPICGTDVFAVGDDQVGTCRRCDELGIVSQLPPLSKRTDLWARMENEPMPRRMLLEALPLFGMYVKPATFRQWVHRRSIAAVDEVGGVARYTLADVRKLLDQVLAKDSAA